jgi:hypothetical protein
MWRRRDLIGAMGMGAAGMALLPVSLAAASDDPAQEDSTHSRMVSECDEACGHCAAACQKAFHHCVVLASNDCAEFCNLSAQLLARHSSFMAVSCSACAEACQRCAQECESASDDPTLKACASACQKCEQSCRNMVRMMGANSVNSGDRPAVRP